MGRLAFLIGTIAIAGCTNVLSPSEAQELERAEERWESQGIHDYTYEMRTSCFCPNDVIEWAVVEVRNDQVVSVRSLDGQPLTGFGLTSRKTVDELFGIAHERPDWLRNIDFEFDAELGYPLRLSLRSKPNIADADATYEARNLKRIAQ